MTPQQTGATTLKELEEHISRLEALLLEKSRQLEAVTRELDDFSFMVSHDLKAPVRAIKGFAGVLVEEQYDKLDADGKRLLNVVNNNARKLGEMIEAMVSQSAISKKNVAYRQVNMRQTAADTVATLLSPDEKQVLTITIADLPACLADETMMKHVWVNVLNMAVLYAEKNGHLGMYVDFEDEDKMTTYYVKVANIAGIKDAGAEGKRLLSASIRQFIDGHGAGSAFIKRVLYKHEGSFWIQTIPERECTFFFSLPKQSSNT